MSNHFTATAGWISVEKRDGGGWHVYRESTGEAATWRGVAFGQYEVGHDDPSVGLQTALEAVGVQRDEAAILARVISAGGEID
jgi:hypothetical protein